MLNKKQAKQSKLRKQVIYWVVLNAGILIMSLGVYLFEAPNEFVMGGVSGISIFLAHFTEETIPFLTQPVWLAVLNVALLLIGFIFLGKGVTFKTIYCSLVYSFEVWLLSYLFPLSGPLTNQTLLEAVYAVLLIGVGCAIMFHCGASSGGSDIIALIFKKYTNLNIGNAVIASDIVVSALAFYFGAQAGLLSILGLLLRAFVVDGIIENIAKTKYVTIITDNPDIVSKVIIEDIDRGFTKYKAEGGYTGAERTIIITVCRRAQAVLLKSKLHEVDPTAFTIITDANEILGKGFTVPLEESVKRRSKKREAECTISPEYSEAESGQPADGDGETTDNNG